MSDIETFYYKVCEAYGTNKPWNELNVAAQQHFIHAVNIIIAVCNGQV